MALQFEICGSCQERHALQKTGAQLIHSTGEGVRCEGSGHPGGVEPAPQTKKQRSRETHRQRLAEPVDPMWIDEEREAAYDLARTRGSRRNGGPLTDEERIARDKFDRRIYVTNGSYVVRGGLPTLGKSR